MRLFLLTFAILGLTGAGAQDRLRIAVVDVTEVFNAHPATKAAEAEPAICPECFSEISPEANRCPNCTTWLKGPNAPVS